MDKMPWLSKSRYAAIYRVLKAIEAGDLYPLVTVAEWSVREYGRDAVDARQLAEDVALYASRLIAALASNGFPGRIVGLDWSSYQSRLRDQIAAMQEGMPDLMRERDQLRAEANALYSERSRLVQEVSDLRRLVKSAKTEIAHKRADMERLASLVAAVKSIAEDAKQLAEVNQ